MKLHLPDKITDAIKELRALHGLEYYAQFLGFVDFYEAGCPPLPFPTFGVTLIKLRLAMLWHSEDLAKMSVAELKWTLLHELFHLLFNHINRSKGYVHLVANIAQDMIINHLLEKHYGPATRHRLTPPVLSQEEWAKMPPEKQGLIKPGDTTTVVLDANYSGPLIFEPLYEWLMEENAKPNQGNLTERTKAMMKWSRDGQTGDAHLPMDEVSDEIRQRVVQAVSEKAKQLARGSHRGDVDEILQLLLQPPKNNNLRYIRKAMGEIRGKIKLNTYRRPSRRASGVKGFRKVGNTLNVIWDWSGSMYGEHEKVASELYRDGYELNIIGSDTEVNRVYKVANKRDLAKVPFNGGGGTVLMPAVNYVSDPKNKMTHSPLVILTDGYTDELDFSGWHGEVLILSCGQECRVRGSERVKQIIIEK